ncbi:hypothetical protein Q9L58_010097 [Maublancomyces gigas]|uniref:Uncharacterized protein n=1 Tax=Discina gigas TaxID=1032678 RepID=A0ABR3G525_9PEZI
MGDPDTLETEERLTMPPSHWHSRSKHSLHPKTSQQVHEQGSLRINPPGTPPPGRQVVLPGRHSTSGSRHRQPIPTGHRRGSTRVQTVTKSRRSWTPEIKMLKSELNNAQQEVRVLDTAEARKERKKAVPNGERQYGKHSGDTGKKHSTCQTGARAEG